MKFKSNDTSAGNLLIPMEDNKNPSRVDEGLIAIFLKMSVEERLLANDNAAIAIKELRRAFRKAKSKRLPK